MQYSTHKVFIVYTSGLFNFVTPANMPTHLWFPQEWSRIPSHSCWRWWAKQKEAPSTGPQTPSLSARQLGQILCPLVRYSATWMALNYNLKESHIAKVSLVIPLIVASLVHNLQQYNEFSYLFITLILWYTAEWP